MTKKHCDFLIALLARQSAECAKRSEEAHQREDRAGKAFQAGAAEAFRLALEYTIAKAKGQQ